MNNLESLSKLKNKYFALRHGQSVANVAKIDSLFLEITELIIGGSYLDKLEKLIYLKKASVKLDLLKFFLQVAWEIKSLDNKKYVAISEKIGDVGKMLGGWIKSLK